MSRHREYGFEETEVPPFVHSWRTTPAQPVFVPLTAPSPPHPEATSPTATSAPSQASLPAPARAETPPRASPPRQHESDPLVRTNASPQRPVPARRSSAFGAAAGIAAACAMSVSPAMLPRVALATVATPRRIVSWRCYPTRSVLCSCVYCAVLQHLRAGQSHGVTCGQRTGVLGT